MTTVPAAAFASVALVEGRFDEAASSALQLVVNLVGIVVAAALTLLIALRLRRRWPRPGWPKGATPARGRGRAAARLPTTRRLAAP